MKKFHFLTTTTHTTSEQTTGPQRVTIPRTINIGGQEFSVADTPELNSLVSLIRQDAAAIEKGKLYPAFEKLQRDYQTLATAEIINPSKGNAGEEVILATAEAKLDQLFKAFTDKLEPLLSANARNEEASLEAYKSKLLQENLGKVIPELVVGTTREEIDASLESSKSLCAKYAPQFGVTNIEYQMQHAPIAKVTPPQVVNQTAPQVAPNTVAPQTQTAPVTNANPETNAIAPERTVVLPSSPASTEIASTEAPNVGSMSMDEFSRRREELRAGLSNVLGN
jgi:hypothetical protein